MEEKDVLAEYRERINAVVEEEKKQKAIVEEFRKAQDYLNLALEKEKLFDLMLDKKTLELKLIDEKIKLFELALEKAIERNDQAEMQKRTEGIERFREESKIIDREVAKIQLERNDIGKEAFTESQANDENIKTLNSLNPTLWNEWLEEKDRYRDQEEWSKFSETLESMGQSLHEIEKTLKDSDRERFESILSRVFEAKCDLHMSPGRTQEEKEAQLYELSAIDAARARYETGEPLYSTFAEYKPEKKEEKEEKGEEKEAADNLKSLDRSFIAEKFLYEKDFGLTGGLESARGTLNGDFARAAEDIIAYRADKYLGRHAPGMEMDMSKKDMKLCVNAVRTEVRAGRRMDNLENTVSGKIYKALMPQCWKNDQHRASREYMNARSSVDRAFSRSVREGEREGGGKEDFKRTRKISF